LFTTELAQRLAGTGVTANALHPGVVASDFSEGNGVFGWFMRRFMSLRGISVEAGAATSIFLATSPAVERVSGCYFVRSQVATCSAAAQDRAASARLWQLSEALTNT
jgi:NAD(P)-dependent dehydrogenase (short-subunit alcohol dehydrogenase family)